MERRDWFAVLVLVLMLAQALTRGEEHEGPRRPVPDLPLEQELPDRPAPPPRDRLPLVEREGRIVLEARQGSTIATGSAFPITDGGLHVTAYHVVQGCDTVMLDEGGGRFRVVEVLGAHPGADLALIHAGRGGVGEPLPFAVDAPSVNSPGFHYGYPGGEPGAAASRLLGRSQIRTSGVRSTLEPVLVWARVAQWPEGLASLGGASGGPTLDASGAILGATIAEDRRRGRLYSAAPESLELLRPEGTVTGRGNAEIDPANWLAVERELRETRRTRRVLCTTGQRMRIGDSVRLVTR